MPEPKQKPGSSKQDYQTPPEFLSAVEKRFGKLSWDLAASRENSVCDCERFFDGEDDSLKQDWNTLKGNLWLNPPFGNIKVWAEKCSEYRGREQIIMLVPASIGSNWFKNYVWGIASVCALNGRLKFVGADGVFPKDLMLCVFSRFSYIGGRLQVWDWKKDAIK